MCIFHICLVRYYVFSWICSLLVICSNYMIEVHFTHVIVPHEISCMLTSDSLHRFCYEYLHYCLHRRNMLPTDSVVYSFEDTWEQRTPPVCNDELFVCWACCLYSFLKPLSPIIVNRNPWRFLRISETQTFLLTNLHWKIELSKWQPWKNQWPGTNPDPLTIFQCCFKSFIYTLFYMYQCSKGRNFRLIFFKFDTNIPFRNSMNKVLSQQSSIKLTPFFERIS